MQHHIKTRKELPSRWALVVSAHRTSLRLNSSCREGPSQTQKRKTTPTARRALFCVEPKKRV
jgi:hypothetical protein